MIAPKRQKPSAREESEAYELATLRDGDVCQRCHRAPGENRDHRKNRSQGGLTVVENLQLLCGTGTTGCHGWAHANPGLAVTEGWAVPGWADPTEFPARRWVRDEVGVQRLVWVLYLPVTVWPVVWRPEDTFVVITEGEAALRITGELKGKAA